MTEAEKNISTLAWTKSDYENAGEEVPEKLSEDDLHTDGELMTREEIDAWVADTYKTFCVLREQNPKQFDKLYDEFVIDVHYLLELGKLDQDEVAGLLNKDNFAL